MEGKKNFLMMILSPDCMLRELFRWSREFAWMPIMRFNLSLYSERYLWIRWMIWLSWSEGNVFTFWMTKRIGLLIPCLTISFQIPTNDDLSTFVIFRLKSSSSSDRLWTSINDFYQRPTSGERLRFLSSQLIWIASLTYDIVWPDSQLLKTF